MQYTSNPSTNTKNFCLMLTLTFTKNDLWPWSFNLIKHETGSTHASFILHYIVQRSRYNSWKEPTQTGQKQYVPWCLISKTVIAPDKEFCIMQLRYCFTVQDSENLLPCMSVFISAGDRHHTGIHVYAWEN